MKTPVEITYGLMNSVMAAERTKRIQRFWRECRVSEDSSVVDIGGTMYFWKLARSLGLPMPRRIVVVNKLFREVRAHPEGAILFPGDARALCL